jgi:hypothetical protein
MIRAAIALCAIGCAACTHITVIGDLDDAGSFSDGGEKDAASARDGAIPTCAKDTDCMPPATVCGPDERCTPGCAASACPSGSTCDAMTGHCTGGKLDQPCTSDGNCDPPDLICNKSSSKCAPGCNLDPDTCYGGWICNFGNGRCCDPDGPNCTPASVAGCSSDGDCAAKPGTVCLLGACEPDCAQSGCTQPMVCGANGHCGPNGACARDADCDLGSYCDSNGSCTVAPVGGAAGCAGGTAVSNACNEKTTPATFRTCVGAAGPASCPYCVDGSCFHPGVCAGAADCHRGDSCSGGLCFATQADCPSTVSAASVIAGMYGAGKELCVHDVVQSAFTGYLGDEVLSLGGMTAVISPVYLGAGVKAPAVNATITAHGTVRWDQGRQKWELHPVDLWF